MSGTIRQWLDWPSWARRAAALLYFLTLNWLMLAPARTFEEVEQFLPHQDKIAHGGLFLTLGVLVRWSMEARDRWVRGWHWGCAALLLYAGAIEALQPVLGGPGRRFDWLDMACNLVGAGAGWLLYGFVGEYDVETSRK